MIFVGIWFRILSRFRKYGAELDPTAFITANSVLLIPFKIDTRSYIKILGYSKSLYYSDKRPKENDYTSPYLVYTLIFAVLRAL